MKKNLFVLAILLANITTCLADCGEYGAWDDLGGGSSGAGIFIFILLIIVCLAMESGDDK